MANNRLYLVHEASGQRVLIAKHFGESWQVYDDASLANRLNQAFRVEADSGVGSTGWHIEYERLGQQDDPLRPSTSETYQSEDGKWHLTRE